MKELLALLILLPLVHLHQLGVELLVQLQHDQFSQQTLLEYRYQLVVQYVSQ
ncbi:Uncharacterised protein [Mycobacteroides abscessus subsp. massiliense]|nr:Uncharacterised protein [Mycobacteroides abscessus subsp. massiliense]